MNTSTDVRQPQALTGGLRTEGPAPQADLSRVVAGRNRNLGLDGLRGIAALSVAFGHCYVQVTGLALWTSRLKDFHTMQTSQVVARVLSAFFPSDAAVMVFFVMSGHVLWESFRRKDMKFFRDLPDYTSSRVYRLIPLTIASAIPLGLLSSVPAHELAENMLLFSHSMNGVLWSLQAEMVASAMLFVLWGLSKGRVWIMLLALLLATAALPYCRGNPNIMFLPAFILGAGITSVPARIWQSTWLLAVGIVVLIFINVVLGHGGVDRCIEMGAAMILVGAVSQGRLPFLRWRLPLFLGAISYPFYLTHVLGLIGAQPILDTFNFASPYPMIAARAALSIPPAILIAWLLHVLVEVPVQRARPKIAWPFKIKWSARLRPLVRRPMQADVLAVTPPDGVGQVPEHR